MADIYTDYNDEKIIDQVKVYGLKTPKSPKYRVLRLALAKSLTIPTPPESLYDRIIQRGSEYTLEVVTGKNKSSDENGRLDFDDAIRSLLSIYHQEDLFQDEKVYKKYLQRHIRRGLKEIRSSWTRSHDFSIFLREELFNQVTFAPDEEHERSDDKIVKALGELGIYAEINNKLSGPRITRYLLYLDNIKHFDTLKRGLDKLAFLLGLSQEGVFLHSTEEAKVIGLDIPRSAGSWRNVYLSNLPELTKDFVPSTLPVWIGKTVTGDNFSFDLAETPHLLVAGATGSGKSMCLHSIILSLLWGLPKEHFKLALIDPKQVELASYSKLSNLYSGDIIRSKGEALELLNALVQEMENRNALFLQRGVKNIQEIGKTDKYNIPYIIVVIEELADLLLQSVELEAPLVRLAQKARSTGIHLVLSTQRPDAETFSGLLRSNIPGRIALKVQKSTESTIILDEKGAEKLLGKGDMLVKLPTLPEPVRVHGAYVTTDDIDRGVNHYRK